MVATRSGRGSDASERSEKRRSSTGVQTKSRRKSSLAKTPAAFTNDRSPDNVLAGGALTTHGAPTTHGETRHRFRFRASTVVSAQKPAAARSPTGQAITINSLPENMLELIFSFLVKDPEYGVINCREVLPLVCQRWNNTLAGPSSLWQNMVIDFESKGTLLLKDFENRANNQLIARLDRAGEVVWLVDGPFANVTGNGSYKNRRIMRTHVEAWIRKRAPAMQSLTLKNSFKDPTHSLLSNGFGLYSIFSSVSSTLRELVITDCGDIVNSDTFEDIAKISQLTKVHIEGLTCEASENAFEEFENLKHLKDLAICFSAASEVATGDGKIDGFPDALCDISTLTSLKLCSKGVTSIPLNIDRIPNLQKLDLSGCPVSYQFRMEADDDETAGVHEALRHIKHLCLNNIKSDGCSNSSFALLMIELNLADSLEVLEFENNGLTSLAAEAWEHTPWATLTRLELGGNNMTSREAWDGLSTMPELRHLGAVASNTAHFPGSVLESCNNLTFLDLSGNPLVDVLADVDPDWVDGLEVIKLARASFPCIPSSLHCLTGLKELDLTGCMYLEVSMSLKDWIELDYGFCSLQKMDLRKAPSPWQATSLKYLGQFVEVYENYHLRLPEILY